LLELVVMSSKNAATVEVLGLNETIIYVEQTQIRNMIFAMDALKVVQTSSIAKRCWRFLELICLSSICRV
jgi:hypothetical protein